MDAARPHDEASPVASFWRPILHRWFVEYNPLYLLSAALVLGGMILVSRGLAEQESVYGSLGVTAIAELYSATLIGGAALLMRTQQRRSAVMLAMLALVYQCDVTLHTETCADLGRVGLVATVAWFGLFGAKLSAIAWAMRLRLSRTTLAALMGGAFGLALLPYALPATTLRAGSAFVMIWLFALSTLARSLVVTSAADLDDWGQTVLRRAVRVTRAIFAVFLAFHVGFWSFQGRVELAQIAPILPLIAARSVRSDAWRAALLGGTLLLTAVLAPAAFSATALLVAATLGLRAREAAPVVEVVASRQESGAVPYRSGSDEPTAGARVTAARVQGWWIGAAASAYLSLWTLGWSGGAWPAHLVPLDLLVTAAGLVGVWLGRAPVGMLPLAAVWVHGVWRAQIIPAPRSALQWGATSIAVGFALLLVSLGASYLLKPAARPGAAEA